jgi:hypothetical protein
MSESDILTEALELYKLKHPKGHSFTFLHCWYLLRKVPRWADGSVTECKKSSRVPAQGRGCREMPHYSDPESECASPNPIVSEATGNQRIRPQRNRTAKEEHKNQKMRDAAMRAQLAATKELAEASKRKADILADQNVLMLFTAPDNRNMIEDSWEYLQLCCRIELKKLRRQLAEEEELERREAATAEKNGGGTGAATTSTWRSVDQAAQSGGADQGDHEVQEDLTQDSEEGAEVRLADPWLSQVLQDDAQEDDEIAEEVDAIADTNRVDQAQRRPPLLNKVGDTHTWISAAGGARRAVPMPRSQGLIVPRVVVDLDEVG